MRVYTEVVALDAIRAAYDALGNGDVEPLVSLMDEEMEWQGRRGGWPGIPVPPDMAPMRPVRFSRQGSNSTDDRGLATGSWKMYAERTPESPSSSPGERPTDRAHDGARS